MAESNLVSLPDLGAALAGLGALSTASFGLLDASKAFGGGVSNIGVGTLATALKPYSGALDVALGEGAWWPVVRANWIAGVGKAEQKAKVIDMIRLGLTPGSAPGLAKAAHVDAARLTAAATKIAKGQSLTSEETDVIGRMNAVVLAVMDAAFESADQRYRNICRLLAGLVAVALALTAHFLPWPGGEPPSLGLTLVVGLLAVPLAPVAKDLTSALSAAMNALKAARRI